MEDIKALLPLLRKAAPRNVPLNLKAHEVVRIVEGLGTRWNWSGASGDDTASDVLSVVHWAHQRERTRQICCSLEVWIKQQLKETEHF